MPLHKSISDTQHRISFLWQIIRQIMQVLFGIMKSVREICGLKVCCAAELQQLGTVGAFAANGFKSYNCTPTAKIF